MRCAGAIAVAALVALSGCGDARPSSQSGRVVSDAEALVLARVLERNWERGGAHLDGAVPLRGVDVALRGRVDFRSGRGTIVLSDGGQPRRYYWTRDVVMAQAAPGSNRYLREPPRPRSDPVHFVLRFVNLLSAETIDNTTNIRDQGARFLRRATLGGRRVDVYRYGARGLICWIGRDDGLLWRVQADTPNGRLDLTVRDHVPVRVTLPRTSA